MWHYRGNYWRAGLVPAALLLQAGNVYADFNFNPYVSAQAEYHSNLFALPDTGNGEDPPDENIYRGIAGLETGYTWTGQKLRLNGELRRVQFQRFEQLDHDEHRIGAGLDYTLFGNSDGVIEFSSEERMASFADRHLDPSDEVSLEEDRSGRVTYNVNMTPSWRLELGGRMREFESPLPDFPDFGLSEDGYSAGLKYIAENKVTAGVVGERINGEFKGIDGGESPYELSTLQASVDYAVSDLSSFQALLGYSIIHAKDDPDLEDVDGITGSLGYKRQLTGLTDVSVRGFRRVGSYIAGANATTDVGGAADINWHATPSIQLSAGYSYTRNLFDALAVAGAVEEGRNDRTQDVNLKLAYQMLSWLSLTGYAVYRERDSNIAEESYEEQIAGVDLRIRWN